MKRTLNTLASQIPLCISEINKNRKGIEKLFQGRPRKNKITERVVFVDAIIEDACEKYHIKEKAIRDIMALPKQKDAEVKFCNNRPSAVYNPILANYAKK
jgi:hypothetical protein